MTRKEIYEKIKELNLEEKIKISFNGRNYTNIPTTELLSFIEKEQVRGNKELSGMTEKRSNTICNMIILNMLFKFIEDNPGVPFGYVLSYFNINDINISENSQKVLWRINSILNRSKRNDRIR